jgi:hypothetical protein
MELLKAVAHDSPYDLGHIEMALFDKATDFCGRAGSLL